jgi:hypothetical protein
LSVGDHVLTLQAANSAGLAASTSVSLTVTGDYDADGLTDEEEFNEGLNPLTESDAYGDGDGDGLTLLVERERDLNPVNADSDGDGRSDGQEVADGTSAAVVDQPLPPDQLNVQPDRLEFTADLSQDVPLPQVAMSVNSRNSVTWTLGANVPWLAANKAFGQTPEAVTILANAFKLTDGVHTGVLTYTSAALNSSVVVPVVITVTNSAGHFDQDGNGFNIGDVQSVANRAPSDSSQEQFDYHYDSDRDGDIDGDDAAVAATRWAADRDCCPEGTPPSSAVLRVDAPDSAAVGDTFTVTVNFEGAVNLGGFEVELAFNPAVLQADGAQLGSLLASGGRTGLPMGPVLDNAAGRVAFGGYSLGLPGSRLNGSGPVALLRFRAVGAGDAGLAAPAHLFASVLDELSVAGTVQVDSLTVTGGSPQPLTVYYISTESSGSVSGINFSDEDVLAFDTQTGVWSLLVDGSDIGLSSTDIKAFHWLPDRTLLMSFGEPVNLPGLGAVDDSDLVRFIPTSLGASTAGSFELYLDGSTVGLSTDNEDVDAVAINAEGELVISTVGTAMVPGAAGELTVREEDLMVRRGDVWHLLFDGSDIGLTDDDEDIKAAEIAADGIYLSTDDHFTAGGLSGDGLDLFACRPLSLGENTQVESCAIRFDGTAQGLSGGAIDAFSIGRSGVQGSFQADDAPSADELSDDDSEVDELPADELPVDVPPVDELPADELPADQEPLPTEESVQATFLPLVANRSQAPLSLDSTAEVVTIDTTAPLTTTAPIDVTEVQSSTGHAQSDSAARPVKLNLPLLLKQ